jgi:hypothetical protein
MPFDGAKPDQRDENSQQEEFERSEDEASDFIVEDGENTLDLPGQFSRHRHRDMSENFKILCQLHVHISLQPPSERNAHMLLRLEGMFTPLPFLDNEFKSLKMSTSLWLGTMCGRRYLDFSHKQSHHKYGKRIS